MKNEKLGDYHDGSMPAAAFILYHGTYYDEDGDIPFVVMVNRWDGKFGFPGGKVDEGETPRQAAVRESIEEIGFRPIEDNLDFLCVHEMNGLRIFNYACKVDGNQILKILTTWALKVGRPVWEITGVSAMHLMAHKDHDDNMTLGFPTWINSSTLVSESCRVSLRELTAQLNLPFPV